MARDRANIRLNMWADQDWRDLTEGAQHLYMLLLSHPTLNYAGVADWKPGRLAAMTRGKTATEIIADGAELEERFFIVVDAESEEVLVRSFIKHDGLMKQPKLVVSMTNAYAAVASRKLREVLAFEVQKLRDRDPGLNAWSVKQVETLLKAKATDIRTFTPALTPALTPTVTPNDGQAQGLPTATTTATATSKDSSPAATEFDFENAYSHWPKKTERAKSLTKFKQLAKQRGVAELTADIIRFGDAYTNHVEKQFVPALVVWLNGERWTDELPGPAAKRVDPSVYYQRPDAPAGKRYAADIIEGI